MQPFLIQCPKCQVSMRVSNPALIGKRVACRKCRTPVRIEQPADSTATIDAAEIEEEEEAAVPQPRAAAARGGTRRTSIAPSKGGGSRKGLWIGLGAGSAALVLIGAGVWFFFLSGDTPKPGPAPVAGGPPAGGGMMPVAPVQTSNDPVPFSKKYIPDGTTGVVSLKPAAIFQSSLVQQAVSKGGPEIQVALAAMEAELGVGIADIPEIVLAVSMNATAEFSAVIHATKPFNTQLITSIPGAKEATANGKKYFILPSPSGGMMPGGMPGGIPGGFPGGIPGGAPEGLPGGIPGGFPGGFPGGGGGAPPGGRPGLPGGQPGQGGGLPGFPGAPRDAQPNAFVPDSHDAALGLFLSPQGAPAGFPGAGAQGGGRPGGAPGGFPGAGQGAAPGRGAQGGAPGQGGPPGGFPGGFPGGGQGGFPGGGQGGLPGGMPGGFPGQGGGMPGGGMDVGALLGALPTLALYVPEPNVLVIGTESMVKALTARSSPDGTVDATLVPLFQGVAQQTVLVVGVGQSGMSRITGAANAASRLGGGPMAGAGGGAGAVPDLTSFLLTANLTADLDISLALNCSSATGLEQLVNQGNLAIGAGRIAVAGMKSSAAGAAGAALADLEKTLASLKLQAQGARITGICKVPGTLLANIEGIQQLVGGNMGGAAGVAGIPGGVPGTPSDPLEAINRALDRELELDEATEPLEALLAFVGTELGFEISIDEKAAAELKVDVAAPVKLAGGKAKIRDIINLLAKPLKLEVCVLADKVVLTTAAGKAALQQSSAAPAAPAAPGRGGGTGAPAAGQGLPGFPGSKP